MTLEGPPVRIEGAFENECRQKDEEKKVGVWFAELIETAVVNGPFT